MTIPDDLIRSLEFIHPRELIPRFKARDFPPVATSIEIRNEVRPADLFCYLAARFGPPNGIQNFLRSDDSDNLIHWDWTLKYRDCLVQFLGLNFRTEIVLLGLPSQPSDSELVANQLKSDFAPYGAKMSEVRRSLEDWVEFVNPYQRVKRSIDRLLHELQSLDLTDKPDSFGFSMMDADNDGQAQWHDAALRYSRAFGLCFGVRSMLPVAAEAFVNLLIYILMRPQLKGDDRLRDNAFRQPIDVRIKSLPITCFGFKQMPDYTSDACRKYHSLVNERNDLLHGNVVIDKLKFNEVFFAGKIPIFKTYRSWWERSMGVELAAVGFDQLHDDVKVVEVLVEYLLACLEDGVREKVQMMVERHELGLKLSTQSVSVLFPPWLVDFRAGGKDGSARESGLGG